MESPASLGQGFSSLLAVVGGAGPGGVSQADPSLADQALVTGDSPAARPTKGRRAVRF